MVCIRKSCEVCVCYFFLVSLHAFLCNVRIYARVTQRRELKKVKVKYSEEVVSHISDGVACDDVASSGGDCK